MLEAATLFFYWFIFFLIYSLIGYIIEVIDMSIEQRKFANRGFMLGPWIPVWGFGALFITLILTPYEGDYLAIFLIGIILCGLLEYATSWVLEKIFHNKWWDYSMFRDNINGRIRLTYLLLFGLGAIVIITFLNPTIYTLLDFFSPVAIIVIGTILLAGCIADVIYSTIVAFESRNRIIIAEELKSQKIAEVEASAREYIQKRMKTFTVHSDRLLKELHLDNLDELKLVKRIKKQLNRDKKHSKKPQN